MKFKKVLIVALVQTMIFGGLFAAEAMAFGRDHGSGHMGAGFFGLKTLIALNLSDEQKAGILSILAKHENDQQSAMNGLRDAGKSLRTALQASPFDEGKIRQAYAQVAALRGEQLVMRARMMSELKAVLTPQQLQLLQDLKAQRLAKMKARVSSWLQNQNN